MLPAPSWVKVPGDERSVLLVWSQGGPIDPMLLYEIIALWAGASGGKLDDSEVNRRLIAPLAAHRGHSLSIGSIRHRRNGVALENFARSMSIAGLKSERQIVFDRE